MQTDDDDFQNQREDWSISLDVGPRSLIFTEASEANIFQHVSC